MDWNGPAAPAAGLAGGLLAALVAFAPSFSFILPGAARFERLLINEAVLALLRRRGGRTARSPDPSLSRSPAGSVHNPFTRSLPLGHKKSQFAENSVWV
jgi:hypothetical protein